MSKCSVGSFVLFAVCVDGLLCAQFSAVGKAPAYLALVGGDPFACRPDFAVAGSGEAEAVNRFVEDKVPRFFTRCASGGGVARLTGGWECSGLRELLLLSWEGGRETVLERVGVGTPQLTVSIGRKKPRPFVGVAGTVSLTPLGLRDA